MKAASLVLASMLAGLLICEAGLRLFQHYRPERASAEDRPFDLKSAAQYIAQLPAIAGTDRAWFTEDPPALPNRSRVRPEDQTRFQDYQRRGLYGPQAGYIWNRLYVEANSCGSGSAFANYPDSVLVFDPPSDDSHPIYRFPPNTTTPSRLVTNQFGLRGPPLALSKPPKTIRIAFVGASTTINNHEYPFSYPERAVDWLNRFALANHYDARFEVLNAGREGIQSRDIQAIVRDELLPLDPDLVVYYEGSNQFSRDQLVSPNIPARKDIDPGDPIVAHKVPELLRAHLATANLLDLALNGFRSIGEPRKPPYELRWPAGVEERNPDLSNPNLPLQLPIILMNLDSIRNSLASVGGQLVLCSFEWFTPVGSRALSPMRHQFIYKQLNTLLWPLRYADIRRLADFQNRVFRRYAESRKIPFLDVASVLPQDPNLFTDAIHMTDTGERVKAWIVFEQLAPLIRREIESGRLPRPGGSHALPPPPSLAASEMSLRCGEKPPGKLAVVKGGLSLYRRQAASPATSIDAGRPLKITTPPQPYAFAAFFKLDVPSAPGGRLYVHIRARTLKGQVGIGVVDQRNVFLLETHLAPASEMTDIYLPVSIPARAEAAMIRNGTLAGAPSEILIEDIELVIASDQKK